MTKHLTKPIRAIHFMVLAFLMTLSSPVAAQAFQKGYDAFSAGDYGVLTLTNDQTLDHPTAPTQHHLRPL